MSTYMKYLNVRIPSELHTRLRLRCVSEDTTIQDIVCRAISDHLDGTGCASDYFCSMLIEAFDGEILTVPLYHLFMEHELVSSVDYCGYSGNDPSLKLYNVKFKNGDEFSFYL